MDRKTFNTIRNRFVIINKKIYNIINSNRDTEEILRKDYNISYYDFKDSVRGYYYDHKLYIYFGYTYMPVPIYFFPDSLFEILKNIIEKHTKDNVTIYNGLKIGECNEFWDPVYELAKYENGDIQMNTLNK